MKLVPDLIKSLRAAANIKPVGLREACLLMEQAAMEIERLHSENARLAVLLVPARSAIANIVMVLDGIAGDTTPALKKLAHDLAGIGLSINAELEQRK